MEMNLLPEIIYDKIPDYLKELTIPFVARERDIVLLSSIGSISACLPKVYGIYSGDKISANLYVLVVAPPASGKGVLNKSRRLVEKIHISVKANSSLRRQICEVDKKQSKDKNTEQCPEIEIKLLPGNVSSSKIYKHLQSSEYGLLIFESEADTISQLLKLDWGSISDVLRKAFHHESLSISREIDDKYFEINNPQLSMVVAGTPNQVQPLIHSKENGLFSRFLFYYFTEPSYWKDVSPNTIRLNANELFDIAGDKLFELYNNLIDTDFEIEIKLNNQQWEQFNSMMSTITTSSINEGLLQIIPIIKRQGVIFFRIIMILTMMRHIDNPLTQEYYCDDDDFFIAKEIVKVTIDHSLEVSRILDSKSNDPKEKLNAREIILLSFLELNFTRNDALVASESLKIPERTLGYMLKKMVELKVIRRESNGNYKKLC